MKLRGPSRSPLWAQGAPYRAGRLATRFPEASGITSGFFWSTVALWLDGYVESITWSGIDMTQSVRGSLASNTFSLQPLGVSQEAVTDHGGREAKEFMSFVAARYCFSIINE